MDRWRSAASRKHLWFPLAAAAIAFVITFSLSANRAANGFISPYDEGYHLSYVQYASSGTVPRVGDPLARWSEDAFSCFPVAPFGRVTLVECGVDGPSDQYPELGTNTAAGWPPAYYFFAASVARASMAISGLDPLHAARLASVLLWSLGAALLAGLGAYASRSLLLGAIIGVLAGTSPATYAIASYVSPHSAALLIGTATVGLAIWAMRTEQAPWKVALALAGWSFLVVMTIPHAIAVLILAAVALFLWGLLGRKSLGWGLLEGISAVAVAGLGYIVWSLIVAARTLPVETAKQASSEPETLLQAVLSSWDVFQPPGGGPDRFHSEVEATLMAVMGIVIVGAAGYVLLTRTINYSRMLAVGLLVATPVAGTLAAYTLNFAVPARYGASLIPAFWWMLNRRKAEWWYVVALGLLALASCALFFLSDYFTK